MLFVKYAIQFYDWKVFIQLTIYLPIYLSSNKYKKNYR